ncbi:MAG: V-type ATP synthase subunit A [Clostridiales bacterium]|jgi:V/A-type H+-transporting ATPase subunit A|nr:V-type ATP synthase subunit A [Clostridiales bacterium]
MEQAGIIAGINGPVVAAKGCDDFRMSETVYVGKSRLIGEVIKITKEEATIQVFEDTSGLKPKDVVVKTGKLLSVTLGPGIVSNIFDGIERPLKAIKEESGIFIEKGVHVSNLDTEKLWDTQILLKEGQEVKGGDFAANVPETSSITHKVMIPPFVSGKVTEVKPDGQYTINDTIAVVENDSKVRFEIKLAQEWPIKTPRPVKKRNTVSAPLITGQRIMDALFPVAKGGMAALPGGFGTGKTMNQHQIAKWSNADIIVYIGCGERGNEMTQVLEEFGDLKDPRTGKALMERTTLIANTSNMPVAAREASIYTGVTIAEYYRDMGYHVAIMADSTSRWAEALRELSGRLEEMPAEEGFPAYLASRLATFYERAGYMENLNGTEGSVTIIGAVSPQGGDFSEPVTQNTKRLVRCFWTLDRNLSYARHFPAINWLTSYSEYLDDLEGWYNKNVGVEFLKYRTEILKLLQEESDLMEIVKLIGSDVLPDSQKVVLELAKVVRLGFAQQNAYHTFDTYVPLEKQKRMMEVILALYEKAKKLVSMGIPMSVLKKEDIFNRIINIKYDIGNDEMPKFDALLTEIDGFYNKVYRENS